MTDAETIMQALDGDAGMQDRLLERLDQEPQLRQELLDQILVGSLLHCAAIRAEGSTAERVRYLLAAQAPRPARPHRKRPHTRRWRPALWLAALVLLALLPLILPWLATPAQRDLHSDALPITASLPAGDQVHLEAHTRLHLLDPNTLRLEAGAVRCQIVPRTDRGFRLLVGQDVLQVLGTVFRVAVAENGVHLRVYEGRVKIVNKDVTIDAGGGALLAPQNTRILAAHAIETFDPMRQTWRMDSNRLAEEELQLVPGEDAHGGYLRCRRRHVIPGKQVPWLSCVAHFPDPGLPVPPEATGISLWLLGRGDGQRYHLALRDHSAAGQEHYSAGFTDTIAGWHRIELPWSAFERWRDFQHDDAVDDGFDHQHFTAMLVGMRLPASGVGPEGFAFDQLDFLVPDEP